MAVSKRAILFIGIITLGLMAAGANAYGGIDMNWLVGNSIFFLTFGFVVLWVFGGFKRKKRLTDEAELDGDKKVQGSRGMPQMWFNGCNL